MPKRTRSGRLPVRDAVAAGGVVLREQDRAVEVVVAGRSADATWVFPKGQPDSEETFAETAVREVGEETGLRVRILVPIGSTDYWFASRGVRFHKVVHFFLMEATGGDVSAHDAEYDEVRWVTVDEARRVLSYDNYRTVLERALERYREIKSARPWPTPR